MKKGQIQQIFIYIMALFVIGFIVLIGYRSINNLMDQKCMIEEQQFHTQLERSIEKSTRYGSITESKINVPCGYERLCIVDSSYFDPLKITGLLAADYKEDFPMIWANTQGDYRVKYNVYLYKAAKPIGIPLIYDERLTTFDPENPGVGEPVICFEPTQGSFSFLLKGLGKKGIYVYK